MSKHLENMRVIMHEMDERDTDLIRRTQQNLDEVVRRMVKNPNAKVKIKAADLVGIQRDLIYSLSDNCLYREACFQSSETIEIQEELIDDVSLENNYLISFLNNKQLLNEYQRWRSGASKQSPFDA